MELTYDERRELLRQKIDGELDQPGREALDDDMVARMRDCEITRLVLGPMFDEHDASSDYQRRFWIVEIPKGEESRWAGLWLLHNQETSHPDGDPPGYDHSPTGRWFATGHLYQRLGEHFMDAGPGAVCVLVSEGYALDC